LKAVVFFYIVGNVVGNASNKDKTIINSLFPGRFFTLKPVHQLPYSLYPIYTLRLSCCNFVVDWVRCSHTKFVCCTAHLRRQSRRNLKCSGYISLLFRMVRMGFERICLLKGYRKAHKSRGAHKGIQRKRN
jgi:hypothetical protein